MHARSHTAAGLAVSVFLALVTVLPAQSFDNLFRVTGCKGDCQVKKPGGTAFEPVFTGKAYPFGTIVRTGLAGELFVLLSPGDSLRVLAQSELTVWEPEGTIANSNRIVRLDAGKVEIIAREGLAEKSLTVETALASVDSFVGRSTMELTKAKKPARNQLDLCQRIHTESDGSLRVRGPQFSIPKMKSGSSVRIESSLDRMITRITNEANDYLLNIENGTDAPVALETTTHSTVRICREQAPIGGKLVVSVLETAPDGKGKGNFAFVLGEPSLTSSGLPLIDEHALTGGVTTATATVGGTTNAPATQKDETLFQ
jgi:hypothetical protein